MKRLSCAPWRQRGIAVITVLLALAIGMLISSEIIMRVYAGMKRSANQFNALQAWEYALGGEEWARQQLGIDYKEDRELRVDHLQEDWAIPAQTLEIEGGFIEIEIYDLQARFNLNNLINDSGQIDNKQVIVFKRLLQQLSIPVVYADMAARWASYADDSGGEYGTDERPYQAGDTPFASISELRLLRDMPQDLYMRLRPFVSVVPFQVQTNVNTASEPVLASLTSVATHEKINMFIEQREMQKEGYTDPSHFVNVMGVQKEEDIDRRALSVGSEYYEIRVRAEYNGRRSYLISTVYRSAETGEILLISRDRSQHFRFEQSRPDPEEESDDEDDEDDESKYGKEDNDKK